MSDDSATPSRPARTPKCARCRNHGLLVPVRGHSKHCGWKQCTCPKCALITERHRIMASYKLLRKTARTKAASPEETREPAPRRQASPGDLYTGPALSSPMLAAECMPNLVNYERESTRMYLGPPLYHYSAFPMGLSPPRFRSTSPSPPPIPITSIRPYHPLGWRMEQDGGAAGDFRSQGYYPSFPPFMPSRYLPGIHYIPPPLPMSVSMRAEASRNMSGFPFPSQLRGRMDEPLDALPQLLMKEHLDRRALLMRAYNLKGGASDTEGDNASSSAEDQSHMIVMERSETSNKELRS